MDVNQFMVATVVSVIIIGLVATTDFSALFKKKVA